MKTKKEILKRLEEYEKVILNARAIGDTQKVNFTKAREEELKWVVSK